MHRPFNRAGAAKAASDEAKAKLESGIADLRFALDVAKGRKAAALGTVRSRCFILGATQTLTSLVKEEAEEVTES